MWVTVMKNSAVFITGSNVKETAPSELISVLSLAKSAANPHVGPKLQAPWFAPHNGQGKTKADAEAATFYALILDHDTDNLSQAGVAALYDTYGFAYLAYTTSSHMQIDDKHPEAQSRWKVVVPFSQGISAEIFSELATGAALLTHTDHAQVRINQICFCPNKTAHDAPYSYIDKISAGALLDPLDTSHAFVASAYAAYGAHAQAQAAPLKPRAVSGADGSIIDKVNDTYSMANVLESFGYQRKGHAFLAPESSSKIAGVHILQGDKERVYSHHESDPLHDGYAHDVFDVFVIRQFFGDQAAAIKHFANTLDAEANKERQRDYMQAKEQERTAQDFAHMQAAQQAQTLSQAGDVDLLNPPGIAGDICRLMQLRARRMRPELYPLSALHLLALAGHKRTSIYTEKLNLITLGIASTAAGKETPQDVIKALANVCGLSSKVSAEPASFKDMIYNLLDGDGANMYVIDEVHSMLQAMKKKNANSYESKIEAEILKLTTTSLYTFRPMEKRQVIQQLKKEQAALEKQLEDVGEETDKGKMLARVQAKIARHIQYIESGWPNPFCSIMGHSVPERLDKLASDPDAIAGGFIGRSLVVRCPEGREPLNMKYNSDKAFSSTLEHELQERLSRIQKVNDVISVTDEASVFINQRIDFYDDDEQRNCEYLGAIYARAPEHLVKVASILAVEKGTITIEHAQYADALVMESIADIRYLLVQAMAKDESAPQIAIRENAALKILKQCKGQGQPYSRVKEMITRNKEWKAMQDKEPTHDYLNELVNDLLEQGRLELVRDGRKERYKTK